VCLEWGAIEAGKHCKYLITKRFSIEGLAAMQALFLLRLCRQRTVSGGDRRKLQTRSA
jgi:hypothetical protein